MPTSLEGGLASAFIQKAALEESKGHYLAAVDHLLVANAFVSSMQLKDALRATASRGRQGQQSLHATVEVLRTEIAKLQPEETRDRRYVTSGIRSKAGWGFASRASDIELPSAPKETVTARQVEREILFHMEALQQKQQWEIAHVEILLKQCVRWTQRTFLGVTIGVLLMSLYVASQVPPVQSLVHWLIRVFG